MKFLIRCQGRRYNRILSEPFPFIGRNIVKERRSPVFALNRENHSALKTISLVRTRGTCQNRTVETLQFSLTNGFLPKALVVNVPLPRYGEGAQRKWRAVDRWMIFWYKGYSLLNYDPPCSCKSSRTGSSSHCTMGVKNGKGTNWNHTTLFLETSQFPAK